VFSVPFDGEKNFIAACSHLKKIKVDCLKQTVKLICVNKNPH
jgi:hypothetical protein